MPQRYRSTLAAIAVRDIRNFIIRFTFHYHTIGHAEHIVDLLPCVPGCSGYLVHTVRRAQRVKGAVAHTPHHQRGHGRRTSPVPQIVLFTHTRHSYFIRPVCSGAICAILGVSCNGGSGDAVIHCPTWSGSGILNAGAGSKRAMPKPMRKKRVPVVPPTVLGV